MEEHKRKAIEYLKASKLNYENGFYDISVILAEEALYIFLVSNLLSYDVKIPWYLDFDGLFRILEKYNKNISKFRENKVMIRALDQIRIMFRYSVPHEIKKEEAEKILSFVEEVINSLNP
ncbi:HEPN domain-containing protein [Sulfurisphaera javensis]|uniref:HEPN domain-containing protein n=1 Tax=Sulfurisphaera javensis TaxID=2049879 RepID=A0AAT9GSC2_9CREN